MRFLEYNGLTVCQQHFRFFSLGCHDGKFRTALGVTSAASIFPIGIAPVHISELGDYSLIVIPNQTVAKAKELEEKYGEYLDSWNDEVRHDMCNKYLVYTFCRNILKKDAAEDISGLGHLLLHSMNVLWSHIFELSYLCNVDAEVANILSLDKSKMIEQLNMSGPCYRSWMNTAPAVHDLFFPKFRGRLSNCLGSLFSSFASLLELVEVSSSVSVESCFWTARFTGAKFYTCLGDNAGTPSLFEIVTCLDVHFMCIQALCDAALIPDDSILRHSLFMYLEWAQEHGHVVSKENVKESKNHYSIKAVPTIKFDKLNHPDLKKDQIVQ